MNRTICIIIIVIIGFVSSIWTIAWGLTYRDDTGIKKVVRLNEPHSPYVQPVTLQESSVNVAQPSRSKGPVSDR